MKLIVGLGNPGKKYAKTRHNVGWLVLDHLVEQVQSSKSKVQSYSEKFKTDRKLKSKIYEIKIGNQRVVLAKPLTFMNNSGEAARLLVNSTRRVKNPQPDGFSFLYVIHDDLDIPLGSFKIQFGRGPKEHKGVESVERMLGTKDFWRVRIGIENRTPKYQIPNTKYRNGEGYVLGKFTGKELKILEKVIPEVVEALDKHLIST